MARLLLGLAHPQTGQACFEFQVRLLTLGGECEAIERIEEMGLSAEKLSVKERSLVDLAYLISQIEIEGIESGLLTPAYLQAHLTTDDYVLIQAEIETLRKKHIDAGESPTVVEAASHA